MQSVVMADQESSPFLASYKAGQGVKMEEMHKAGQGGRMEKMAGTSPTLQVKNGKKLFLAVFCGVVVILPVLITIGVIIGVLTSRGQCDRPPLLLISLDGFQAGYLQRDLTPNLHKLINSGVTASYMKSSFPTLTFPNHYSIVTGLYPESHGLVNNNFYDTKLREKFSMKSPNATDSKWWEGEPVWVTAVKNKLIAAVYFWPGSEAEIKGVRPSTYFPYDGSVPFNERVDTALGWLDLPNDKRPQFLALYFNQPDHAGHQYGPNSAQVNTSLGEVDAVIGRLWEGLVQRELSNCINIMIISDHGMSATNTSTIVDELLPSDLASSENISYPSYGPVMNIGFTGGGDVLVQEVYDSLVANGTGMGESFRAFHTRDVPLRLHTGHFNKQRYGPLYLIADDHSYLVPTSARNKPPAGSHGYDNLERNMRAIFIAHGPAFKKGYVAEAFENIQLYSLMCELLNITPASNNGTTGSLNHILDPQVAKKLPPAEAPGGSPGVDNTCPFPGDNDTFVMRSICEACVCNDSCSVDNASILANNLDSFDHTPEQESQFQRQHFPWGVPPGGRGNGACVLTQPGFVHLYSNKLHIPILVGYTLTGKVLNDGVTADVCNRRDPRVTPANSANCSLYNTTNSNFKNLTLWNSREEDTFSAFSWVLPTTTSSMDYGLSTSVLSATVPLWQSFVREVWTPLRVAISDWLRVHGTLNIMVGSVLDADRDGLRDPDPAYPRVEGVAVPSHVFVVVTRCLGDEEVGSCDAGDLDAMGMLFQHPLETGDYTNGTRVLRYGLTTLRDIERVTGLNFFPALTVEQQNILELRLVDELWPKS